jgi:hypothetical protein
MSIIKDGAGAADGSGFRQALGSGSSGSFLPRMPLGVLIGLAQDGNSCIRRRPIAAPPCSAMTSNGSCQTQADDEAWVTGYRGLDSWFTRSWLEVLFKSEASHRKADACGREIAAIHRTA